MFTKKIYEQRDYRLFPGFYESIVDGDAWERMIREDYYDDPDDAVIIDDIIEEPGFWKHFRQLIANKQVELWSEALSKHNDIIKDLKLSDVWSPKEYNFMTDMLEVECEVDIKKLHQYCKRRKQKFNEYLWNLYHRRDGFIPFFYPSYDGIKDHDSCDSVMIDFLILEGTDFNTNENDYNLYDYAMELDPWTVADYNPA